MNLETVKSQTQFFPPSVEEESLNPVWFPFVEVRKPCSSLIHIVMSFRSLLATAESSKLGFTVDCYSKTVSGLRWISASHNESWKDTAQNV